MQRLILVSYTGTLSGRRWTAWKATRSYREDRLPELESD